MWVEGVRAVRGAVEHSLKEFVVFEVWECDESVCGCQISGSVCAPDESHLFVFSFYDCVWFVTTFDCSATNMVEGVELLALCADVFLVAVDIHGAGVTHYGNYLPLIDTASDDNGLYCVVCE